MLLLIDNYDSFTYNLYQYLAELGAEVVVHRNDAITTDDIAAMQPERIVISPGPCTPAEAGISTEVVRRFAGKLPILGVCLGHQCIAAAFGGVVEGAGEIVHGKLSTIEHDGRGVFAGLPNPFRAVRYHSLAANPASLPAELEVTARSESGVVMGAASHAVGDRGRAVPPGEHHDGRGQGPAAQLPGDGGGNRSS